MKSYYLVKMYGCEYGFGLALNQACSPDLQATMVACFTPTPSPQPLPWLSQHHPHPPTPRKKL